jgi:hypothetical protein
MCASVVGEEDGSRVSPGLAHHVELGGPRRRLHLLSVGDARSHCARQRGSKAGSGRRHTAGGTMSSRCWSELAGISYEVLKEVSMAAVG